MVITALLLFGCRQRHPREVYVHKDLKEGAIEKIAVFPVAATSAVPSDELDIACNTLDELLHSELYKRTDYKFIPMTTIVPALETTELRSRVDKWMERWVDHQEVDNELFDKLAQVLQADAVLLGVVDRWERMDAIQDMTTPATTVAFSITIIELEDGTTMYQASDEDYLEGERSHKISFTTYHDDAKERIRDRGGSPPPEQIEVAGAIVKSLVDNLPAPKKKDETQQE
jgi:hypothetical protein